MQYWLFPESRVIGKQMKKTPLHIAASAGRLDVAGLLMLKGADIYAEDCVSVLYASE